MKNFLKNNLLLEENRNFKEKMRFLAVNQKNTENNKDAVSDVQNGFIIKQTVDRITVCDKYMQIKFKCGVTVDRKYVE